MTPTLLNELNHFMYEKILHKIIKRLSNSQKGGVIGSSTN
jgi:hypothetical protein